jgi:membrane-associated phospholipid phosphatase
MKARWALAVSVALFVLIAADLILHGPLTSADPASSIWLHAHMQAGLTRFLFFFTHLHSTIGLIAMSAGIALVLALKQRVRYIPWLLLTVQGGQLLNVLVKNAFQRPRPHFDEPLVTLASYSFPSGHAAGSTVFWGFVCVLAWSWPARPPVRRLLAVIAPLLVALTCLSRVYLGAHYLTDVVAGVCEGVAWVCVCTALRARTMHA